MSITRGVGVGAVDMTRTRKRGRQRGLDATCLDDLTDDVNDGIGNEIGRSARQRTDMASLVLIALAVASSDNQIPASSVNNGVPTAGSGHLPLSELEDMKARLREMWIKRRATEAAQNNREPPIEFKTVAEQFVKYSPEQQQQYIEAQLAYIDAQLAHIDAQPIRIDGVMGAQGTLEHRENPERRRF